MTRRTLIKILRLAAESPKGLRRERIYRISSGIKQKEIDRVLAADWLDKGIHGLVSQELIPSYRNKPSRRLFITPCGRDFLRRVIVNPYALPAFSQGRPAYMSLEAKRYADKKNRKAQKRRRNQRKYWAVRANPRYTAATYDAYVDASRFPAIGGKGWEALDVVIKIRLLRQRVRQRALRERFQQIAREAS